MFTSVLNFFAGLWDVAKSIAQGAWNVVLAGWTWAVGVVVMLFGLVSFVVERISSAVTELVGLFASLTVPDPNASQSVGDWLAVGNTFFPLQEMFSMLVLLSATWITVMTYRLIKSWIPTLS